MYLVAAGLDEPQSDCLRRNTGADMGFFVCGSCQRVASLEHLIDDFIQDVKRCLEAGMDDYVIKPINTADLLAAID